MTWFAGKTINNLADQLATLHAAVLSYREAVRAGTEVEQNTARNRLFEMVAG